MSILKLQTLGGEIIAVDSKALTRHSATIRNKLKSMGHEQII